MVKVGLLPGFEVVLARLVRLFFGILLVIGATSSAYGQDVEALLDRNEIEQREVVTLTVRVTGDVSGSPKIPHMDDWTVRYLGQETSFSMVNLSVSRSTSFNYLLSPQKSGSLPIPAITVKVDGRILRTQELQVKVTRASPSGRSDPGADESKVSGQSEDITVQVELEPRSVYVGEQVRQTLRIYTALPLGDSIQVGRRPVPGTIEEQVPDSAQRRYTTNLDGRSFRVEEATWVFYPVTSGALVVPSMDINVPVLVQRRRGRRSVNPLFDDFFGLQPQVQPRSFRSEEQTIEVKPLPRKGRPADFSGLVGQFGAEGILSSDSIVLGDSSTLTVNVRGVGNIRNLSLSIPQEPTFKVYDDTPVVNILFGKDGEVISEKVFKRAIVPQVSGKLTVPPVSINYFNPKTSQYEAASTRFYALDVSPGSNGETSLAGAAVVQGLDKRAIAVEGEDILPIFSGSNLLRNRHLPLSSPVVLIGLFAPALLFGAGHLLRWLVIGRTADPVVRRMKNALGVARGGLRQIRTADNGGERDSLDLLSRVLRNYLGDKFALEGGALTSRDARALLERAGVSVARAEETEQLLESIEQTRYAPGGGEGRLKTLTQRTRALMEMLEKELG